MKNDIILFINHIKSYNNEIPFNQKLLNVPVKDFVETITLQFGIFIYVKKLHLYVCSDTATEFNFTKPPIFSSELHDTCKWIKSFEQNHNLFYITKLERKNLIENNECPDFTHYESKLIKRQIKKKSKFLLNLFGVYNNVSDLYKYGSREDVKKYEIEKSIGKKIEFPYSVQ